MATDVHGAVSPEPEISDGAGVLPSSPPTAGATPSSPRSPGAPPGSGEVAVRVAGLVREFDRRRVVDGLQLDIQAGEFVALLGRSGCGKSTLLRVLAGLDREIEGEVLVPRRRAVAFQAPRLMPWKRVWRNVLLGLPGRPERATAERALAEVGLDHRADAWPKTLSGGEAQRASLARALVRDPDLLLLDEPFGALDALTRIKAQRLVAELWQERGCAVLLVTHDVEEALLLSDRVLVMEGGRIAYETAVDLPRPRDVTDPRCAALRARLLGRLGVADADGGEAEEGNATEEGKATAVAGGVVDGAREAVAA
ncbi:ABC transporter ATP-binding protein [Streptomyces sp. CB02959]|uniref:ABC transporter ATP-binding protein n=1 Tax=Streptomyces sp. CB02959 TaxID=2020330 RepID=UPI002152127E|nr:ABC transporter ATP-binding protein [Streptomyces sp. CB02959]